MTDIGTDDEFEALLDECDELARAAYGASAAVLVTFTRANVYRAEVNLEPTALSRLDEPESSTAILTCTSNNRRDALRALRAMLATDSATRH